MLLERAVDIMMLNTLTRKLILALLTLVGSLRLGLGLFAWRAANVLEKPSYTVLGRLPGRVELRQYERYMIAETTISAPTMREGSNVGFRTVAGYIFGKNKPRRTGRAGPVKMSMTAPVRVAQPVSQSGTGGSVKMSMTAPVRSSSDGSQVKVSFVVPSEYTMETAPTPSDRAVSLCTVAPHCLAVRTFSGPPPSERRVELERSRVVEALGAAGLQIAPGADGAETLIYGAAWLTLPHIPPLPPLTTTIRTQH